MKQKSSSDTNYTEQIQLRDVEVEEPKNANSNFDVERIEARPSPGLLAGRLHLIRYLDISQSLWYKFEKLRGWNKGMNDCSRHVKSLFPTWFCRMY